MPMTRKLEPSEWQAYFDRVSRLLPTMKVELRVAGLDLGAQVEVDRTTLLGISYDPPSRSIDIATEDVSHRITAPRSVHVLERDGALQCVEVVDREGHKQILELSPLLKLPAPEA
jgi:hypothetical protein